MSSEQPTSITLDINDPSSQPIPPQQQTQLITDDELTNKEKKKKNKEKGKDKDGNPKKKDKGNLDPSDTVDYISHNGQHYELLRVQPKSKYDVKMHMTNERTFFKYLFASFHLGAMGTFLLQYYSQPSFYKPVLIGFIWLTAFSFILLGLYSYYQRRQFLLLGRMKQLNGLQFHGPTYILIFFFIIFISILIYSIDKLPSKTKLHNDGDNILNPDFKSHQTGTPTPFTTLLPSG
jgi:hypothetical protein